MKYLMTLAAAMMATLASAAIDSHKIDTLPGWDEELPSNMYSGFINVDKDQGKFLHYWLVESEGSPSTDPLLIWFNGGPGCSSMDGFLYEHGPLLVDKVDKHSGKLYRNPDSWSTIANVLYIEAPAGVGFSFSTNPLKGYSTDDDITAANNYEFVSNFLDGFPEYRDRDLFISGESYAGIYVPSLAHVIMEKNELVAETEQINLKGIMVGNGCIGSKKGICSGRQDIEVNYLFNHGLFSPTTYKTIEDNCDFMGKVEDADGLKCMSAMSDMSKEVGNVNIYNIYGDCTDVEVNNDFHRAPTFMSTTYQDMLTSFSEVELEVGGEVQVKGPVGCIDDIAARDYLNRDDVKKAIHVSESTVDEWRVCTGAIEYRSTIEDETVSHYPDLVSKYNVLIFNGDADACVPFTDNQEWTAGMGYPVQDPWRPWIVDSNPAGYVTTYETEGEGSFTFATVKGSGHMVPQVKPKQGLAMLKRFMNGDKL